MEGKEPFKIKFTTVLIVVAMLFIIIGILSYNFERTNSVLKEVSHMSNNNSELGRPHTSSEPNDYDFFSENYTEALKSILNSEQSIVRSTTVLKGITSIELDVLGDVYLNIDPASPLYEKYGKNPKIASNVMDFEVCETGEESWPMLYLINVDGSVSKLTGYTLNENQFLQGELNTEIVQSLSGIVKVITVPYKETTITAFVDVNGFIYGPDGEAFE